ncbi:MAG: signal peptidase I [Gammaproteobacteria bacterium RIFCSPHIGHO2_12_FULL_45_9]|nr:MAG: signal peptidase I [Gammaproteobacteria bacterium RIFCSPHIGHO2_12_FULL_45_9]
MWNFDFLNILALLTIFSGIVLGIDWIWRHHRGRKPDTSETRPWLIEQAHAFFPVLLIVLLFRAFCFQPYRVPSGSLEPTVLPGDFMIVSQFDYGLRLPLWDIFLWQGHEPKRGQIVLFRWPVNPEVTFVKRLVGLPGDHIRYVNKVLYVNGKEATQRDLGAFDEILNDGTTQRVEQYEEDLLGVRHRILVNPDRPGHDFGDIVVPPGSYFMVGDNRDNSDDSRDWGFVSRAELIGRARFVWMSWNTVHSGVRWNRIGIGL